MKLFFTIRHKLPTPLYSLDRVVRHRLDLPNFDRPFRLSLPELIISLSLSLLRLFPNPPYHCHPPKQNPLNHPTHLAIPTRLTPNTSNTQTTRRYGQASARYRKTRLNRRACVRGSLVFPHSLSLSRLSETRQSWVTSAGLCHCRAGVGMMMVMVEVSYNTLLWSMYHREVGVQLVRGFGCWVFEVG